MSDFILHPKIAEYKAEAEKRIEKLTAFSPLMEFAEALAEKHPPITMNAWYCGDISRIVINAVCKNITESAALIKSLSAHGLKYRTKPTIKELRGSWWFETTDHLDLDLDVSFSGGKCRLVQVGSKEIPAQVVPIMEMRCDDMSLEEVAE